MFSNRKALKEYLKNAQVNQMVKIALVNHDSHFGHSQAVYAEEPLQAFAT